MLDEVNPKLYELCEAAVSQIIDRFVSSLEKKFSEMSGLYGFSGTQG